jgi:hypothetical protein
VLDTLSELRFLAEAKATNLEPKVSSAAAESRVLSAPRSTEDECLDIYEDAIREVRRRIDRARRRPEIKETVQQREFWVLHGGEGQRPEAVAETYGVTPGYVESIRARHGRTKTTGLPPKPRSGGPKRRAEP